MRNITRVIKWLCCKLLYKVEVHNSEALDKYNSYLICPNHSCVFDPVFVYPGKYENNVHIMAKAELFNHISFRWLAKRFNIFPIDREKTDVRSLLKSLDVFKNDENAKLLMFPEGKIVIEESDAGRVYKKGAAFVAAHINKPIVPVFITRRPKFFQKVDVIFGEPFFLDTKEQNGQNKMEHLSQEIIDSIYKLNSNSDSEG